jgi:hypothetical protein
MKCFLITLIVAVSLSLNSPAQFVAGVVDYTPAPGQLINTQGAGSNQAAFSTIGTLSGMVSLGSFGGSILYQFEKPILNHPDNPYGVDFVIFGNPQPDWAEPGIVLVMKDANQNGLPDDVWYELAGSDHFFQSTKRNISITYYNPFSSGAADVMWFSDELGSGYLLSNSFHKQNYFPMGELTDNLNHTSLQYNGTCLDSKVDVSNPALVKSYHRRFGYADNNLRLNSDYRYPDNPYTPEIEGCGGDAMDISWAIDSEGNYVELDQIDFVRIYTGVLANAGWTGEISTEICGIAVVPVNKNLKSNGNCIVIEHVKKILLEGEVILLDAVLFINGRYINNADILWASDNPSVIDVDINGRLKALSKGKATLTAYSKAHPSIRNSIEFEVKSPGSFLVEFESTVIKVDEKIEIQAKLLDESGISINGFEFEYFSSDQGVVKIENSNGRYYLYGIREGESDISAKLKGTQLTSELRKVNVIAGNNEKSVFIMVKDDHSTILSRNRLDVTNFNLNNYVSNRQSDYSLSKVKEITLAHAVVQAFMSMGLGADFAFRDDERGNNELYIWKVPKGDYMNVEFIYGYGGNRSEELFSKCWVVMINNEQIINGLNNYPIKNGDEILLYHVPNVSADWRVSYLISDKSEMMLSDTLEVFSTEITCWLDKLGKVLVKNTTPVQFQPIMVDRKAAYFNGNWVITDETGKAALKFNDPGLKKISAGIDEMVVSVLGSNAVNARKVDDFLTVWPNPARDYIKIKSDESIQKIYIQDLAGVIVRSETFLKNTKEILLPLDQLKSGVFLLSVYSQGGVFNKKIVIQ